ncbi:Putative flippase GtrA (transmembrane translocase of bactoprenol-linked glucose) [Ruminococcus sp. YE71]|uniref:GtrA family protein n=1 Tax=unclassified Ruminococcus TaxID=2608920 RepID=UPI00088F18BC|nr:MULTISPECIES: GtrA family protein [unclassified Ruminococcus]SDA14453.1 Putative flippase GtrA (transmembrane translocase of bactoprenol-linked glucose) [Ruminococcus sp. YE78]SFW21048.1 Putative flippase GtrA (transmembrane translocase of bactoprenol-linked glucose) [Ruminococcus sp. YE71]
MEENKHPDIFDRIMSVGFLKRFEPFYKAHKEVLMYLFFGGCTTVVSVAAFALGTKMFGTHSAHFAGLSFDAGVVAANVFSWVCAVTFAYITNRIWVFEDKAHGTGAVAKECAAFFAGRLFTLVVETVLLEVSISKFGMKDVIAKIIVSVVTIVLNYVISKLFVFKSRQAV